MSDASPTDPGGRPMFRLPAAAVAAFAAAAVLPAPARHAPATQRKPTVALSFPRGANLYHLQLQLTTATGRAYDFGPQLVQTAGGKDAMAFVVHALRERNWDADPEVDFRMKIGGFKGADGKLDPVADVVYTVYRSEATPFEVPRATGLRGVTTVTEAPPPAKRPDPAPGNGPGALVSFPPGIGVKVTLTMTTAGGDTSASEAVPVNEATAGKAREVVRKKLPDGWVVEELGDGGLLVTGKRKKDGKTDPVSSLTLTYAPLGASLVTPNAQLSGLGGVTVRRTPAVKP